MATYSTDLTTLTTAESGTLTEFGRPYNGAGAPGQSGAQFIQGTDCFSQNTGNKGVGLTLSLVYNHGVGVTFATDEVLFAWIFYFAGTNLETYANSGWRIGIGSGTGTWDWFRVGGSDYGSHKYGGWFNFAIDPTATESGTIGGGNGGTYRYFGNIPYTLNAVTKGDPVAMDALRYGRGELSITGTGGTFSELAEYNDYNAGGTPPGTSSTSVDSGRHVLGIFQQAGGSYLWKGLLSLGTVASSVTFSDSIITIIIDDCPHTYASFNKIEVNNASSSVTLTSVTIISTASTANGIGYFEMVANATVIKNACLFVNMGTFIYLSNGAITGSSYIGCGQITHGGADFDSCIFSGYEGTADTSYMLLSTTSDPDTLTSGCSFKMGTALTHAMEFDATNTPTTITLRNIDFSGYHATNGNTSSALYFPSTTKSYTVNLIGCTGDISYKVGSGGSVTLVFDPVDLSIKVQNEAKVAIENAQVSIHLLNSPFTELMNEDSLSTGLAEAQYSGSVPVDIVWKVRKSDNEDLIRYVPQSDTSQVTSNGFSQIVTLKVNTKIPNLFPQDNSAAGLEIDSLGSLIADRAATVTSDTTTFDTGIASIKIVAGATTFANAYVLLTGLVVGGSYKIIASAKSNVYTTQDIYHSNTSGWTTSSQVEVTGTSFASYNITAIAASSSARISFRASSNAGDSESGNTLWIDSVRIIRVWP
jgi:hypothetical protein